MRTTHEFPIELSGATIQVSADVRPLHVAVQNGQPTLWCLVDTEAPKFAHDVYVFGTGHKVDRAEDDYVGTFHQAGHVWHVFMATKDLTNSLDCHQTADHSPDAGEKVEP